MIERKGRSRSLRLWGQVRPQSAPTISVQIKPKGADDYTDLAPVRLRADGTWTHRLRLRTGANYRYRWTPAPTLTDPMPGPRYSGSVDPSRREKTALRAGGAF